MSSNAARILITGASSGVGAALAARLGRRGAALALLGRDKIRLQGVASQVRDLGATKAAIVPVDLGLTAGPAEAWSASVRELGAPPMSVICCHGIGRHGPAEAVSLEDYDESFSVNVRSIFALLQSAVPHMRTAGAGNFVVVSSVLGRACSSDRVLYCGAKHAIEGIVGAARHDLKGSGVKCSTVCPAAIDTPWWDKAMYPDGKIRPKPADKHLLSADDVVDAIVELLDQDEESNIRTMVLRKGKDVERISN